MIKNSLTLLALSFFLFSCGPSDEERDQADEKVEQEVEETSDKLFDSLEEDVQESKTKEES